MKTSDGKVILRVTRNPCEKKDYKNMDKILNAVLGSKSKSLKSFLWNCPIPKVCCLLISFFH